jgi:hypothetical protein
MPRHPRYKVGCQQVDPHGALHDKGGAIRHGAAAAAHAGPAVNGREDKAVMICSVMPSLHPVGGLWRWLQLKCYS